MLDAAAEGGEGCEGERRYLPAARTADVWMNVCNRRRISSYNDGVVRNGGSLTLLLPIPWQMMVGVSWGKVSRREEGDSSRTELRQRADVVVILDARTRCL